MKIAVYARVSTDSIDQANSLENQKSYFERFIKEKGYKLYKIYADAGLTGTMLNNRPEFNQMLYDAGIDIIEVYGNKRDKRLSKKHILYEVSERQPAFEEIWIKNTSRFARNTLSFDIISKLRIKGVNIWFMEQNLNTKEIGSDLLLKLVQIFDEQDSRDKSLKVRTGQREGAIKGKINVSNKLFGYKYIQPENRLEIIEEEAVVIRKIFSMYAGGLGIRRIINKLTEDGHFTREGKPFGKTSISRILDNEKYAGINARLKYDTGMVFAKNSYAKVKPKSEWLIVPTDKIPAIISKELFDQCEDIRHGRVNYQQQKGVYKGITEYAGLIYCSECGNTYISNVDRGRRFYNCSTKKNNGTAACSNPNIPLHIIENTITEEQYKTALISRIHNHAKPLRKLAEELTLSLENNRDNKEIDVLQDQLKKLKGKKDRYVEMYSDGIISKIELQEKALPLDSEIKAVEERIHQLTKTNDEIINDIAEIYDVIETLYNVEVQKHYTQDEIIADIDRIIVNPDKTLKVIYKTEKTISAIAAKYTTEIKG